MGDLLSFLGTSEGKLIRAIVIGLAIGAIGGVWYVVKDVLDTGRGKKSREKSGPPRG